MRELCDQRAVGREPARIPPQPSGLGVADQKSAAALARALSFALGCLAPPLGDGQRNLADEAL